MTKPPVDSLIGIDGDTWRVLSAGATNDAGEVYLHLASTTRFVAQRNGRRPIQECRWVGTAEIV